MTEKTDEADSNESVEVVTDRTTASVHHPSTVILATETLEQIGVRAGEIVQLSTSHGENAYAIAETGESTGLDVGVDELLADVPVFSALFCGLGERVFVSPATLPEADHFTVVPVDATTTSVLEQCSVTSSGLVDAVAHDGGIVEFQPDDADDYNSAEPYYARIKTVCPEAPARVTENTRVDIADLSIDEHQQGVLSSGERRELYTTNLGTQPADSELRTRLRERLETSLQDLRLLAERLPDKDIEQVFGGTDDNAPSMTSVAIDVVALCWLGFDLADETPAWRIEQAIERALYARNEDGEVNLRVTRQALSPAATSLDRFRRHGSDTLDTYRTLERLWADPAIDPFELYDVTCEQLGEDFAIPPSELLIERLVYRAQARRFPPAQVMDVSVDKSSEET